MTFSLLSAKILSCCFVTSQLLILLNSPSFAKPPLTRNAPPKPTVTESQIHLVAKSPLRRIDDKNFRGIRRKSTKFAYAHLGDHEDAGILTDGGGRFFGVYAVHRIYTESEFSLTPPQNATQAQTLYAPTTRPPNGSCLEVGTAYRTAPGQPTRVTVYVYDFCNKSGYFAFEHPADQTFLDTYAGAKIDNQRAYALAIFTADPMISSNTSWYAQLYNFHLRRWDTLYHTSGYYADDKRGWTIFETWFNPGQCSKNLKPLVAADISYYDADSHRWFDADNQMTGLTMMAHGGADCFDPNGPPSYKFHHEGRWNTWEVVSTGD